MEYKIIDVSRYQGRIDWRRVKADGVDGAMLKTVSTNPDFGGVYIDPFFEENYAECTRLGIPVGVYYYTYAQDKTYRDTELARLKKALRGKTLQLPVAVDVEDNSLTPLPSATITDLVLYALSTIESWGAYAMLYTYTSYKNVHLDMDRLSAYDIWQADYRDIQPRGVGMWQYTSQGRVQGVNGRCDVSIAYKNYPAIIKNAGLNDFTSAPQTRTPNRLLRFVKRLVRLIKGEAA